MSGVSTPLLISHAQPETSLICGNKWLDKTLTHLRAWPGRTFPWSEDLPAWCLRGYDLVVAFEKIEDSISYDDFPRVRRQAQGQPYPYEPNSTTPENASGELKALIDAQVHLWKIHPPKASTTSLKERNAINEVIGRVTLGRANKEWNCPMNAAQNELIEVIGSLPRGVYANAIMPYCRDEINRRAGPNPTDQDTARLFEEVKTEKMASGELHVVFEKLMVKYGGKDESWSYKAAIHGV